MIVNAKMQEIQNRKEYVKATMADGVAVLEGTATWCTQCRAIAPLVEELVKKFPSARFYKYDVEVAEDVAHVGLTSREVNRRRDLLTDT